MENDSSEMKLRDEFDRWAEDGRGGGLEEHHRPIVEPTLALMDLQPIDRVLDVGCGTGWLCRTIAPRLSHGICVGIDVSDAMVERARAENARFPNVQFLAAGADKIPWQDNFFTKVISVESAYYWPDPAAGIREICRALAPGGSAWILINYYIENPFAHHWGAQLAVPTHLLSADAWTRFLRDAGLTNVAHRRIPDLSPTPETYAGSAFKDSAQMRKFKETGALLVFGTKPSSGSR